MKVYRCYTEDGRFAVRCRAQNLISAMQWLFPNSEVMFFKGGKKRAEVHTPSGLYVIEEAEGE